MNLINIIKKKQSYKKELFITVENIDNLKKYFCFKKDFTIEEKDLDKINFIEDVNDRKRMDAKVLSLIAANVNPGNMLDIGTYLGHSATRMAINSPLSKIFSVNINPNEIKNGGKLTTGSPSLKQIGSFYKEKQISNIKQIIANKKTWEIPKEIDNLSLVYIDGCHDKDYVYSDTIKIIDRVMKGGFILWHDCSPIYRQNFSWINESMLGIEKLFQEGKLNGYVLNTKHSWIGIWKKS